MVKVPAWALKEVEEPIDEKTDFIEAPPWVGNELAEPIEPVAERGEQEAPPFIVTFDASSLDGQIIVMAEEGRIVLALARKGRQRKVLSLRRSEAAKLATAIKAAMEWL